MLAASRGRLRLVALAAVSLVPLAFLVIFFVVPVAGMLVRGFTTAGALDLPAIGPDTVAQAALAGLSGIVWQAGGVLVLDTAATTAAAEDAGLFLWARG